MAMIAETICASCQFIASLRMKERFDHEVVDVELLQVGERRVAGAEVIDRETEAEVAERRDAFGRAPVVLHQDALGDLQLDTIHLQSRLPDEIPGTPQHPGVGERPGGNVEPPAGDRLGNLRRVPGARSAGSQLA